MLRQYQQSTNLANVPRLAGATDVSDWDEGAPDPRRCFRGSNRLIDLAAPARIAAGGRIAVNRYVIQKGLDRQLVLYWYQAHGRVVASEYWGKFYLIADAFRLNRTDGAIVRVTAPVGSEPQNESDAETRAIGFIEGLLPLLPDYLPG